MYSTKLQGQCNHPNFEKVYKPHILIHKWLFYIMSKHSSNWIAWILVDQTYYFILKRCDIYIVKHNEKPLKEIKQNIKSDSEG